MRLSIGGNAFNKAVSVISGFTSACLRIARHDCPPGTVIYEGSRGSGFLLDYMAARKCMQQTDIKSAGHIPMTPHCRERGRGASAIRCGRGIAFPVVLMSSPTARSMAVITCHETVNTKEGFAITVTCGLHADP